MVQPRNPILEIIDGSKRGWLDRPPVAEGSTALVVFPRNREPFVHRAGALRNADFKAATKIYKINIGDDFFSFNGTVPSSDDAFSFEITGEIRYTIADPLRIVERNIQDCRSDIQQLVIAATKTVSRDQDPGDIKQVQREIRHEVEGEKGAAATRLARDGYALKDLSLTIKREKIMTDIDREIQVQKKTEQLRDVNRQHKINEADHLRKVLAGSPEERMAYWASLSPQALASVLENLSVHELQSMQHEMNMMGELVKDLEDHQKQKFFNQLKQRVEQRFASSRMLKSEDVKGALPDKGPDKAGESSVEAKEADQQRSVGE